MKDIDILRECVEYMQEFIKIKFNAKITHIDNSEWGTIKTWRVEFRHNNMDCNYHFDKSQVLEEVQYRVNCRVENTIFKTLIEKDK